MHRFAGLAAMVLLCAASRAGANGTLASVRWAERLLAHSCFECQLSQGSGAQWNLRDAEAAFGHILTKYGKENGRAWAGLARAQAGLGKCAEAEDSYKRALQLLPGHTTLTNEMSRVRDQRAIAKAVSADLPEGETVLQALPYPVRSAPDLWAVLSARVKWWEDDVPPLWPDIDGCHLTIVRGRPGSLTCVWRSGVLGTRADELFSDVCVFVRDVTGDSTPDLVVPEIFYGASWAPSHIDIFTWRGGKVRHLLGAFADDPHVMEDLNHDGRLEVMGDHAVGWGIGHAGQPRWLYIYAYKDGSYRLAEKDFPGQYRDLFREIKATLREFPDDFELLYYYGRCCEIRRMPRTALSAYRRAVRPALHEIARCRAEHWTELARRASNTLREIRKRIGALSRR